MLQKLSNLFKETEARDFPWVIANLGVKGIASL